jgi:hypothetical protein
MQNARRDRGEHQASIVRVGRALPVLAWLVLSGCRPDGPASPASSQTSVQTTSQATRQTTGGQAEELDLQLDGPIGPGGMCTAQADCSAGLTCVDGVCCMTACAGGVIDCQACNLPPPGMPMPDGVCRPLELGTGCDDGDLCTVNDTCDGMTVTCRAGTPVVCVGDACNASTCNPGTGVCARTPLPDDTACEDGNRCTQTGSCQAGMCIGDNPVVCPAPDQCHDPGTCDVATGMCSNPPKPNMSPCNDGNMCTIADRCMAGVCVMGGTLDCNDSDPCTTDTCGPLSGCLRTPIAGCPGAMDAGTDASGAADASGDALADGPVTDGATDRAVTSDARDAPDDTGDARPDGAAGRDGPAADGAATDAARDAAIDAARDAARTSGPIERVAGGGCDCDVGRPAPGRLVQLPIVLGLALLWRRRRRRR